MNDHNATIPMRPRRMSREFLAVGTLLTPAQERLHVLDTARVPAPPPEALTTGRLEERYARRLRKQHEWPRVVGTTVVVIATMLGLVVGCAIAAMVHL